MTYSSKGRRCPKPVPCDHVQVVYTDPAHVVETRPDPNNDTDRDTFMKSGRS